MIVKDEEAFLEEALQSVRDLCDECVVVDTGSGDRTVEIARDLGAQVSHFAWEDDFSAARNASLRRCRGEWILVLDADERLRLRGADRRVLDDLLTPGSHFPFEGLALPVVNTTLAGAPISSFFSTRIFPNDPRVGYEGRIHNRLQALDGRDRQLHVRRWGTPEIIHLGYDGELYRRRRKAERSLPLIESTVRERPQDWQYHFYLGREYLLVGRPACAIEALERTVAGVAEQLRADGDRSLLEAASSFLLQAYAQTEGTAERAVAAARTAIARCPDHPDLELGLAQALARVGDHDAAIAAAEQALAHLDAPAARAGHATLAHRQWEVLECLGRLCWSAGRLPDAYQAYLAALPVKPSASPGWPVMLNSLCGLAIELGDRARVPALLDRLLARDDTPLGMFLYEVERRHRDESSTQARSLLASGLSQCPRLRSDPDYGRVAGLLGVDR